MHTPPDLGVHLDGLRSALLAFVRYGERAGAAAPVPTCPRWTVRDLVAHQGMVHRWAAATLGGRPVAPEAVEAEGRAAPDLWEWLRDGAIEVAATIHATPPEARAPVFLADAPGPRAFWARRQCHETTIHAVDALAAHRGRRPTAAEAGWIDDQVALDGIDELLTGFLPRPRSRLRAPDPLVLRVVPDVANADDAAGDPGAAGVWWSVRIGPEPVVTTRHRGAAGVDDGAGVGTGEGDDVDQGPQPDVTLTGSAVELYLALWNRSAPIAPVGGAADLLARWPDLAAVRWS